MGSIIWFVILLILSIGLKIGAKKAKKAAAAKSGYGKDELESASKWLNVSSGLSCGLAFLIVILSLFVSVPTGHVGVITVFGEVQDNILHEGINVKLPWQDIHHLSIREQVHEHSMNAASSKGIMIDIKMDIVYQLHPSLAANIYQTVGEDYYAILIDPLINRTAKDVIVNYMAEDMYTGMRPVVNTEIETALRRELEPLGITLLRAPITNMEIPADLKAALETRQVEEYNVQTAQQRLEQERVEAERKRVEAEGIRDFQTTVSAGIDENLLYWKYIEVMGSLANSPNNTFIILPTDVLANFPFQQ